MALHHLAGKLLERETMAVTPKQLDNLKKGGNPGQKTRYVTAGQLLDAIEARFGEPFAQSQADVFFDYYQRSLHPEATAADHKTFLSLFIHFSKTLTQAAPQQVEIEDKKNLSTEELRARAVEMARELLKTNE